MLCTLDGTWIEENKWYFVVGQLNILFNFRIDSFHSWTMRNPSVSCQMDQRHFDNFDIWKLFETRICSHIWFTNHVGSFFEFSDSLPPRPIGAVSLLFVTPIFPLMWLVYVPLGHRSQIMKWHSQSQYIFENFSMHFGVQRGSLKFV